MSSSWMLSRSRKTTTRALALSSLRPPTAKQRWSSPRRASSNRFAGGLEMLAQAKSDLELVVAKEHLARGAVLHDTCAVAGAWTYRNGEDVGIYAIGTVPECRRRGFARALMLHVLADARRHGVRTASLQSTEMGQSLYASLGFGAVCRYEEWVPA